MWRWAWFGFRVVDKTKISGQCHAGNEQSRGEDEDDNEKYRPGWILYWLVGCLLKNKASEYLFFIALQKYIFVYFIDTSVLLENTDI